VSISWGAAREERVRKIGEKRGASSLSFLSVFRSNVFRAALRLTERLEERRKHQMFQVKHNFL